MALTVTERGIGDECLSVSLWGIWADALGNPGFANETRLMIFETLLHVFQSFELKSATEQRPIHSAPMAICKK
jgi:hypothetical protein